MFIKESWEAVLPSYEWLLLDGIDYDEGWYITSQYNNNI